MHKIEENNNNPLDIKREKMLINGKNKFRFEILK